MTTKRTRIGSGISQLDQILGGLYIGDNVVWYDDAGSLAWLFCMSFIRTSKANNKDLIYVSFDRSPKNLLEKLGKLAENPRMTILDCFTHGKGAGSDIFLKFYENRPTDWPCPIVKIDAPSDMAQVTRAFYDIHQSMRGDVRFIFESLTGMQELWNGEEQIIKFYSHSCPRLYELNTVAYWIIEKQAHSQRLRAQINQIAQVAIDLSVKRGKTFLTPIKAEARGLDILNRPHCYWTKGLDFTFEGESLQPGQLDIGTRLKDLRVRRGLSQTELAKRVGVTPSTISQVESNLIYPSLPALVKMAEVLGIGLERFFGGVADPQSRIVYTGSDAVAVQLPRLPKAALGASQLIPEDEIDRADPYVLEIGPGKKIAGHFFNHKGEEIGYVLEGKVQLKMGQTAHTAGPGDVIRLTSETPSQWENSGVEPVRLLWLKIK